MPPRTAPPSERFHRAALALRNLGAVYTSALSSRSILAPRRRRRLAQEFAWGMLDALDVELSVCGPASPAVSPVLLVANHVSWLDVYALNAVAPACFVAKSDVRDWPVFGTIATRFGTLFIVRGSYRDAARVRRAAADVLRAGERVVVFPEGTTTDGTLVERFYPALFQAAIDARTLVQPVALRYLDARGRPTRGAIFVGDMTLVTSIRRVIAEPSLNAELAFGQPLDAAAHTRKELAHLAREWIAATLGLRGETMALKPRRAA